MLNRLDEANEVLFELLRFTDPMTDAKVNAFASIHASKSGFHAMALKLALNALDAAKAGSGAYTDAEARVQQGFETLEWAHLAGTWSKGRGARTPEKYEMF